MNDSERPVLNPCLMSLCTVLALSTLSSAYADEVKVTPYRPTVTNSASLSAPGWLELEAGGMLQTDKGGSQRNSLPYLAKLAFTPDFGILLGGEAVVAATTPGQPRLLGGGDTAVLLKHRLLLEAESNTALGCEYGFKAPTAAQGLGSGQRDYVLNGIFSTDVRAHSIDINLNATRLGDVAVGESAYVYGLSGTAFRQIDDHWGVMAELSGTLRRGTAPQDQVLAAVSYAWSPRLVLDAGLSAGLSQASHRIALFAGASMLLGQVR